MELIDKLEIRIAEILSAMAALRAANRGLCEEKDAAVVAFEQERARLAPLQEKVEALDMLEAKVASLSLLEEENIRLKDELARANAAKGVVALKIDRLLNKLSAQAIKT